MLPPAGLLRVGLAVSAAEWSGVAFLTGGKTDGRREVVCGLKNAVERLEQRMPPA